MTFPTIPTVAAGRVLFTLNTAGGGTKTFPNLSSLTKAAGDLLIAICVEYDGNSTNAEFSSWGGGFTEFGDFAGTTTMAIGCAYKWSTGSETGTFTVTTADTSTNDSVMILLSIPGAHATTPPEAGGFFTGDSVNADPGSFSPSWGAEDTLWIAVGASGETSLAGAYQGVIGGPGTPYTDLAISGPTADAVGAAEVGVAFAQVNAATEDPPAFDTDISNARAGALTIAVRPAPTVVTGVAAGDFSFTGAAAGGVAGGAGEITPRQSSGWGVSTSGDTEQATSPTLTIVPEDGDLVVVAIMVGKNAGGLGSATCSPDQDSWTAVTPLTDAGDSTHRNFWFYRIWTTGDATALTFTASTSVKWAMVAMAWAGTNPTGPIGQNATAEHTPAGSTSHTTATITPAADGCWVGATFADRSGSLWTPPGGYVERVDQRLSGSPTVTSPAITLVDSDAVIGAGSPLSLTGTGTISTSTATTWIFELVPAAGGAPTVEGVGQGAFTFDGSAAGTPEVLGQAPAAVAFAGAASGVPTVLGAGQGTYGFSGASQGVPTVLGQAAAAAAFAGAASGFGGKAGTAEGQFTFTGTSGGQRAVLGAATATFGFAADAAGTPTVLGAGLAAVAFAGPAVGVPTVLGVAVGDVAFAGTASGQIAGIVTGQAQGVYSFGATAAGVPTVLGAGVAALGFSGAAAGQPIPPILGQAQGAYAFAGTGQGIPTVPGVAAGSFSFAGTAAGTPISPIPGQGQGVYAFAGTATGLPTVLGQGAAAVAFTGTAAGLREVVGVAVGDYTLTGAAAGLVPPDAIPGHGIARVGTTTGHARVGTTPGRAYVDKTRGKVTVG